MHAHPSPLTVEVCVTSPGTSPERRREVRRVMASSYIGTTIEFYDFLLYGTAAAVVFNQLFFTDLDPLAGTLASFSTLAVGYLARPLGGIVFGHFGDRIGRKSMLVTTMSIMGLASFLIGLLPTYEAIGLWAPVLLVALRVIQGIAVGGEWGGAALMTLEHAEPDRRGFAASFSNMGGPSGAVLATAVFGLFSLLPEDAFLSWGWRIPFLFSVVLILIGYYVRRKVEESPVFNEIAERKKQTQMPIVALFRKHALLVLVAALVFAGNNAVGYMTTGGYIQRYSTDPDGPVALDQAAVLWAVAGSAVTWLVFTWLAGWLSDRIGRRRTYLIGWILQLVGVITLFPLVNTGNIGLLFLGLAILTVGLGFTYGPQGALYSELFSASIRFSGVSISYAIGAIIGGAFAPTIAQALVQATGSTTSVTWYLAGMTVLGLIATLLLRDRSGIPLGPDHEAEQAASPIHGVSRA